MPEKRDETTMTITVNGTTSAPFTADDLKRATAALTAKRKPKMKHDTDFAKMSDATYNVAASELRTFIERFEYLEAEKKDIADQQKEVMAEAKGRGYNTKILRKIIALRKHDASDVAEEEAVLEIYKAALGMA